MPRYTATLEWTPTDEGRSLDDVVRALADHGAHAATALDGRAGLALTVEASDIRAAAGTAVDLAVDALGSDTTAPPQLTGLSITTSGIGQPELSTWVAPDVVRVPDIAKLAGVSRQRVLQWTKDRDDFPAALIATSYGALYPRAAVLRWLEQPRHAGPRSKRGSSAEQTSSEETSPKGPQT
jgi:hypothetical protein